MIGEYRAVDHPEVWPTACILCGQQKGPLVDTGIDKAAGGEMWRFYLCEICVEKSARVLGKVEGEKMDELRDADRFLAVARREIAELRSQRDKLAGVVAGGQRQLEQWSEEKEHLEGRIRQLEEQLQQRARADLDLVGGEVA